MSMNTNFHGRLRNTSLPTSRGLLPLFEAVVNSIQAIEDTPEGAAHGRVLITILREAQGALDLANSKAKMGPQPVEKIQGFKILDNGIGFNRENFESFETLDSDYKSDKGCRGVGRLLWLKAFDRIAVRSIFREGDGAPQRRDFSFTPRLGVTNLQLKEVPADSVIETEVTLDSFVAKYREKAPKTARAIAHSLLEHCLWYFVREAGVPKITVIDGDESLSLDELYDEYMFSSTDRETISIRGHDFELTHVRLSIGSTKGHSIAWCAAGRVVDDESLVGKIPGLHGRVRDESGDFVYCCYVASKYLDEHVRPERIGFDLERGADLFSENEIDFKEVDHEIRGKVQDYLKEYLLQSIATAKARVYEFVSTKAPRYRPVLHRMPDQIDFDPELSDRDLELLLHKMLSELEGELVDEGHQMMALMDKELPHRYQERLQSYLSKADDIKKSDLASYVFHRKVILDIFSKAIERQPNGKYAREDLIHELIMPMQSTSNEVLQNGSNLWLVDERLAFHNYLASDKPLSSMPIVDTSSTKEPDICALNVFDKPMLVSETSQLPLASIVVIEIKRPMRNDAAVGEEKDPIEQALNYLERIREGKVQTATGRLVPNSRDIPGYCYVVCDLTSTVARRCMHAGLSVTSDHSGYFGYNPNFKAYIEVMSFDRLINAARERNRAFFDRLGLPTN